MASGVVGNLKFDGAKSNGKFSVPSNWQVYFSEIELKAKTYNAYFSCIKNARILWFEDTSYPTGYTGYGKGIIKTMPNKLQKILFLQDSKVHAEFASLYS